jgi:alpha-glucosidase
VDGHVWWQRGVVYQVYPRSFQDSDGDGVGDLDGIRRQLDHLVDLGVDAVWISPVYPSPMEDFGYDVTDHCGIDPLFGDLDAFDRLLSAAHDAGLRVVLDFVAGHTSHLHPWFVAARSSRDDPQRDWFIWADPAPDGGPPNNWLSVFGGPAWEFDEGTGQYYLHIHLVSQPNLAWRNPQVEAAMHGVMRFWLDRGVDGFRVDAVDHIAPDPRLPDNPPDPDWRDGQDPARQFRWLHTAHTPRVYELVRGIRQVADEYEPERVLIGEAYGTLDQVMGYYGDALDGFQLPFNLGLIGAEWDAAVLASLIRDYEDALPEGAWPNWVLGNHDRSRIASRVWPAQARVAAMLLLTLRGTPTIYQGDELGMSDVPIPADAVQDPWGIQVPGFGRDPVRTPMPWTDGPGRGFTDGEPWLPFGTTTPADEQRDDPSSMLRLHQRLLALRRSEPALAVGDIEAVHAADGVLTYQRNHDGRRLGVALNLTGEPQPDPFPDAPVLLSTVPAGPPEGDTARLSADEGRVVALDAAAPR